MNLLDVNECESLPCANGATCIDEIDGYTCHCTEAWLGELCTGNAHRDRKPQNTSVLMFVSFDVNLQLKLAIA